VPNNKEKNMKYLFIILLLTFNASTQAQQTTASAGGDASGIGGTFSYSIGQVVYTYIYGSDVIVAQGVQQPYEISTLGSDNYQINLVMQTYPNPTKDYLVLNVHSIDLSNIIFQLYDLNGILIETRTIFSPIETICMVNLPSSVYFLKVINNNKEETAFKIVKN
jgi:hypothetical protein